MLFRQIFWIEMGGHIYFLAGGLDKCSGERHDWDPTPHWGNLGRVYCLVCNPCPTSCGVALGLHLLHPSSCWHEQPREKTGRPGWVVDIVGVGWGLRACWSRSFSRRRRSWFQSLVLIYLSGAMMMVEAFTGGIS